MRLNIPSTTAYLLPLAVVLSSSKQCSSYLMPEATKPPAAFVANVKATSPINKVNDRTNLGDLAVPTIGMGTIAWTSSSWTSLENDDLEECVDLAYQSNAAFLDTAERYGSHMKTMFGMGYGETEKLTQKFLASAMKEHPEQQNEADFLKPVVATKFTPVPWRTDAESVVKACEQSRENLGVDQIDLYQIHMPDIVRPFKSFGIGDKPKDELYWDGLAECYHRGLVKNVGVCNYGPTLVSKCQEHLAKRGVPLASNQIGYSLLGRHNGAQETLDKCNELGVKVLAYYPFAMGLLTGKYSSDELKAASNAKESDNASLLSFKRSSLELKDLERYAKGDGETIPKGGITPLLQSMETIAANRGKTVAQVALNYIISKGAIPIPGCRTADQLKDNIGAMGWRLTETEIAMLELDADMLGFGFDGAGFKRTSEKFVGYGVEKFALE